MASAIEIVMMICCVIGAVLAALDKNYTELSWTVCCLIWVGNTRMYRKAYEDSI